MEVKVKAPDCGSAQPPLQPDPRMGFANTNRERTHSYAHTDKRARSLHKDRAQNQVRPRTRISAHHMRSEPTAQIWLGRD